MMTTTTMVVAMGEYMMSFCHPSLFVANVIKIPKIQQLISCWYSYQYVHTVVIVLSCCCIIQPRHLFLVLYQVIPGQDQVYTWYGRSRCGYSWSRWCCTVTLPRYYSRPPRFACVYSNKKTVFARCASAVIGRHRLLLTAVRGKSLYRVLDSQIVLVPRSKIRII